MFLTRMALDVNRPSVQRALENRSELEPMMDDAMDGEPVRPLWRIDLMGHRMYLMLQSPLRPTMLALHETYGVLGAFPSWETVYIGDDLEALHRGSRWLFDLCACPGENALTPMAQKAWLMEISAGCGFSLKTEEFSVMYEESVRCGDGKTLSAVRFSGMLTIADHEAFVQALLGGIGGNELGLGLMTLDKPGMVSDM